MGDDDRLLQQSLGGNARTCLIVNVPPGTDHLGESYCSILFGQRAMTVAVVARINRQIDYAQLYNAAQAKLDVKDEAISQLQVKEKARLSTLAKEKVLSNSHYLPRYCVGRLNGQRYYKTRATCSRNWNGCHRRKKSF